MWFALALCSAMLLGLYDVFKKLSLHGNAVIPVLFFNTLISALIFSPFILLSSRGGLSSSSAFFVASGTPLMHALVWVKAIIVLSSWVCGYFAIKHLPLTFAGPINATRPVMTLVGALLVFGERLNVWQWCGVLLAIVAFFLLSRSGKKEGIRFAHNRWILLLVLAAVLGAISALYDKYLLSSGESGGRAVGAMFVQSWFAVYQWLLMTVVLVIWAHNNHYFSHLFKGQPNVSSERFEWRWSIVGISLFLCAADFCYFNALSYDGALIAVVSMTRRSSVLVSFAFGAFLLHEKNVRSKVVDLLLVLLSLIFLCLGAIVG